MINKDRRTRLLLAMLGHLGYRCLTFYNQIGRKLQHHVKRPSSREVLQYYYELIENSLKLLYKGKSKISRTLTVKLIKHFHFNWVYNYHHSRAGLMVENTFGMLAERWRVFGKMMECSVEKGMHSSTQLPLCTDQLSSAQWWKKGTSQMDGGR